MTQDRRLDKVARALTPKQVVVLWLEEPLRFESIYEYLDFVRGQPESYAPIPRPTEQIDQAIRREMRGQPKEVIQAYVHRAVKDVVFLIKLRLQVNYGRQCFLYVCQRSQSFAYP